MSEYDNRVRIYRAQHDKDNPYFLMRRDTAQDTNLSFEARGMLAYLLSKPSDWMLVISDLMRAGQCGRDRVRRILRELLDKGYAVRTAQRGEDGRYSTVDYAVYESPQTEKPSTDNPALDNLPLQSNEENRIQKKRALPEKNGNGTHLEVTEQHIAQSDTPAPKRKRDPQYDAIAEVFDTDVSGKIVNLQGQLFHSKKVRGEWESMKIHPPMSIDELREWARWEKKNMRRYADGQERMPATPEVIARHIEDWRKLRNPSPEPKYAFEPDWTKQRPETPEDPQPWNPMYDKNDPKTWVKKPDFWGQPYKYVLVEDDAPAPEPVDVSSIPF